jgi:D-xylose 1-dehydrogenase (NADP+, D-xylono-1,5-lactone-forming)
VSAAPLRWGLMGTARINRAVIPPIRASKRHELRAVASRDRSKGEAYAREWGIPVVHGTYEAMLADPEIDVVYNPLPNALHATWTIRAVEAGKHVLCEKPLAISVAEVDAVAAAAAAHRCVVAEAFMYRHHPQTLRMRQLVAEGAIGTLQLVRSTFTFRLTRPADVRLARALGGGSLWDVGCYPVSMARYLAGAEPFEVVGWARPGPSGIDERFAGMLDFGSAIAQFDCGFTTPLRTHLEVVGTEGVISVPVPFKPGLEGRVLLVRGDRAEEVVVDGQELYSGEIDDMAAAVLEGRPPRVSLADSRGNVATLVALHESARLGRPVRIEPTERAVT